MKFKVVESWASHTWLLALDCLVDAGGSREPHQAAGGCQLSSSWLDCGDRHDGTEVINVSAEEAGGGLWIAAWRDVVPQQRPYYYYY